MVCSKYSVFGDYDNLPSITVINYFTCLQCSINGFRKNGCIKTFKHRNIRDFIPFA